MTCIDKSYEGIPTYKLQQQLVRIKNEIIKREGFYTNKFEWISTKDALPPKITMTEVGMCDEREVQVFEECLLTNGDEVGVGIISDLIELVGRGEGHEVIAGEGFSLESTDKQPFATHWMQIPKPDVLST